MYPVKGQKSDTIDSVIQAQVSTVLGSQYPTQNEFQHIYNITANMNEKKNYLYLECQCHRFVKKVTMKM